MIARITGTLIDLDGNTALIDLAAPGSIPGSGPHGDSTSGGGLAYEVLLPAFAAHRLAVSLGQSVTLHTLHFLESNNQGSTFIPRLAGFLTPQDKAFYELFVTCKGIGHRRALRAMIFPANQLANAIADRDLKLLQTMPEVGKKTAESIALTLRDKVDRFITAAPPEAGAAGSTQPGTSDTADVAGPLSRSAMEVLVQLGENRAQALNWIDQALAQDDAPNDVESLIAEVYRIKGGG